MLRTLGALDLDRDGAFEGEDLVVSDFLLEHPLPYSWIASAKVLLASYSDSSCLTIHEFMLSPFRRLTW